MAKSDLLKQAIADAKTVKETALANAKIALQEAFAPRLTRMFAEKLDAGLMDEEDEANIEAGAEAGAEMGAEMGAEAGAEMGGDFNWTDDTLAASVGGKDYNFQVGMAGGEEMAPEEEAPASEEEMTAEYNEGMGHEDLDISEIIRELEEDAMMDDSDEMLGTDIEEGMYFEDEYSDEDATMKDMGSEMSDIDEIIESILREEGEMAPEEAPASDEEAMMEEMEAELEAKDEELKEAYRTVKQLQSVINEVNLLNAKLLYTNKLFRNFELSEPQKMKVIENFDRAANTREAKLVFATLAESFKRPTKKRVVKESYASKATTTTAPSKQTTQILSEGFEMANRWKKLAGLL
jgi:hypothetical protein